ncbi:MAG: TspO and MBR like protein [Microgenomates group bacterium GW2011_GWC1_49_7]|nr:MAG: TspO and MBR like protein [Microgenomates group bacterium GW2011_GWC1_49_7]
MAFRTRSSSFRKLLILVFGVAFGLVALVLAYQGIKGSTDIRSRAAQEGDVYTSWDFTRDAQGWKTTGQHALSVVRGRLQLTVGRSSNVPAITNTKVQSVLPIGKKYIALYMAATFASVPKPIPTIIVPREAPVSEEDADFAQAMGGGTICTQEAQHCPDGSYVGRVSPECKFAPCPVSPTDVRTPPNQPIPKTGYRPFTMLVYYKLAGKPWSRTPLKLEGKIGSSYSRVLIPFPETLPEGGAITIARLRLVFTSGFRQSDRILIDWIQLLGPKKKPTVIPTRGPTPTATPRPTPTPTPIVCQTGLKDYTPNKPYACASGYSLGISFTCWDGLKGSINEGTVCYSIADMKADATRRCAGRSNCPQPTSYPTSVSIYPTTITGVPIPSTPTPYFIPSQ